jgi:putative tryptophan/tyrosine transport system substrate-binding protein
MMRRAFITLLGGAAVTWPLAARAQQSLPVVGFLHQGSAESLSLTSAFRKGLSEVGFLDGHNVAIEDRAADGHYDRLPALAAELVEHRVAVIAANYLPAALAAKAATQTIPIVFLSGSDPIGAGLVSSMNRPTGNVTGIAPMFTLLGTKNLDLLHELVPKATAIGALANASNPNAEHQIQDLEAAARILGVEIVVLAGSDDGELDSSFATIAKRQIRALVITADGFLISRRDKIVALAARYAYNVSIKPVRRGGWPDELWRQSSRRISTNRCLCRKDSQGCKACGFACSATDQSRVRHQCQNRKGPGSPRPG